ncbi:MAG: hypothetical protein ER33_00765 [Cyanobium sp. CACIAM 14]|nr:MAG: hypothetical protein ER33_00765 [Cyanobium sp. CACIAM 14]
MADPEPSHSDLPAPYTSPWGQLGTALRAVLATLRLKLRELWRRNVEGDLSVPGFWPRSLAPLFWPLLLALLLALPLLLWRLQSQRPGVPEKVVLSPPHSEPEATGPVPASEPAAVTGPMASQAPASLPASPSPSAPASPPPEPPPPPTLELDPLLALLADDDPDHLIASAHPEPAEGRLVLTMTSAYTLQGPAGKRRWAERWQARALALGYRRLELVDGDGRLLARAALVGSGMILLDPGPPA